MAQCSIWGNGYVSSCLSEILPPSSCIASGLLILGMYHLYSRKGNILRRPEYMTVLSPLAIKLELLCLLLGGVLSFIRGYQSDTVLSTASPPAYLLLLVKLRLSSGSSLIPTLQTHSVVLYTLQCIFCAVTAHAQVVTNAAQPLLLTTLIQSAIFAILSLLHLASTRQPMDNNDAGDIRKDMTASFLSRMSFSWLDELVWKAFRATLEVPGLYPLSEEHKSETIAREFSSISSANLLRRLWQLTKYDAPALGGWAAVNSVAVYISPALIQIFLTYLDAADGTAWLCVGGFLAGGILAGTADCQCEWKRRQISAKVRAVLVNEIYEKVLRKRITRSTSGEDGEATGGDIFNLMSVDAESVSAVSGDLYFVWVAFPVQTGIGTWLLYRLLGISGVLGVLAMILLLPLNFLVARRAMAVQAQVLAASDKRIHATNDVLNNLKTIKYSAWVQPFMKRVLSKRSAEINELRARYIWWSVNMTTFHALPFVVTMITLFLYTVVWGGSLRTSTAFPALAIFGIIRIPLDRMASAASFMMRAYVSLRRIESFLLEGETGKYQQLSASASDSDSSRVGFENATFSWPSAVVGTSADHTSGEDILLTAMPASPFRLGNLNIAFQTNALNIVCGPSGAGKSSLLLSLLGEMDLLHGRVFLAHDENPSSSSSFNNTTAYCPQDPWIMNRSIRDNILMEQPFDGPRYERVLHATALQPDLAAMDHGDLALTGEGGCRLSGGQKQRIALARALYSPCKCVLLDDCLSAMDVHTANHVFFHGIKGLLMRGRTCILATHAVQLVTPHCGYVVVLDEGRVVGQGTPEKVISEGLVASDYVGTSSTQAHVESATLEYSVEVDDKPHDVEPQSTYTETRAEGKVAWAVMRTYLATMGKKSYWILVLIMFGAQQIATLGTSLWIKQWASEYDKESSSKPNVSYYIAVYAAIFLFYMLITFVRDLFTLHGALRASAAIYSSLLGAILNATPLFFDRTPLGQITNRLTKDVEAMDQSLPGFSINALQLVASMAMMLVLISTVVPVFLVAAVFICAAYYLVTVLYINGARDLKRIESVQRSPIYQNFSESVAGCVSLRAYAHATASFTHQNRVLVDSINQAYLLQWATQAWLMFRIDVLSSLVSFFTSMFVLLNSSRIDRGSAGLVLTFAASFTENVMWFVQIYSILQRDLNSIERILEYVGVEQEEEKKDRGIYDLPSPWPTEGRVSFHSFTARYTNDLDPVLDDVSFEIPPGQRVAVVGRTGAGKSSLALALIRALRPDTGHVEIDGVDIRSLPLEQLRQAITLVPQDPQLFEGTIRDNLDPLQMHSNAELVSLLRDMHVSQATDSYLNQAATTLSRGQRQLLCIVRGILRKTRILVLDEATASLDHDTDAAIQATLRISIAQGTTVLTIAHRLHTVADYDKLVVLDGGRVVEDGPVAELLERRAAFWRLCEEAGYQPG
ncbi:uncharacterized protein TRUGW13939_08768 [Talaromyces rugulosus]|uniref:P-loop containing nucleoside triphosphate hydrolase protein n=1 Tax=Talaromyces rugulosus TaxID=121627 RepID=A0A7H8R5Z2_TALRU|nr:uncharacterized protein TRUGW13939_08768 [Talaromyces rugulosus]QKX61616.1 hypothetical protein TRUGW13939_08768 [Talaromyces rugulosus]